MAGTLFVYSSPTLQGAISSTLNATDRWGGKRTFGGPSTMEPLAKQRMRKSQRAGPLFDVHGLIPEGNGVIHFRAVVVLCGSVCPSTISGFIATRVVDSVKTKTGWTWSHIVQESQEGHAPLRAHRNTSSAILREARPFRIERSTFRVAPSVVFSCMTQAMDLRHTEILA